MNSSIILKLDGELLRELILSAQERIYLVVPGVYEKTARAIIENNALFIKKKVIVNIDEDKIRGGYGNIEAIELLRDNEVILQELNDSIISFIIVDEEGFILYPESRIIPGIGKNENAIRMDSQMILRLIAKYFPEDRDREIKQYNKKSKQDKKETLRILKEEQPKSGIRQVEEKKLVEIKEEFKRNPVMNPDLKRHLTTYTSKLQYVEFSFSGVHLDKKKIKIPSNALPVRDKDFLNRLEVNMNLFGDFNDKKDYPLRKLEVQVNKIRKEYITPIGKGKSIIFKNQKPAFEEQVAKIKKAIKGLPKDIYKILNDEIKTTRQNIANELYKFYFENPPDSIAGYSQNDEYKDIFKEMVNDEVNKVMAKIKFPIPTDLLKKEIKLEVFYSDVTLEDLKSKKFLEKMVERKVISESQKGEIASFNDAVGVKS